MGSSGVFIGVNNPPDYGELGSLLYAEADAEAMARLMADRCGVEPEVLTGERATRTNIEKAVRSAGQGDLFVFFYAGHGRHLGDHYHLYPYDTDASGYGTLSLGDLSRLWRRNFDYDHVLAILDACRSEGSRGGGLDDPSLRDIKAVCQGTRRVEVIYGCGLDQVSHEFKELGHGLLTHSLLTYLREHRGALSAFDWADNAADLMSQWCNQNKQAIRQSPWWDGPLGKAERLILIPGTIEMEHPAPSPVQPPRREPSPTPSPEVKQPGPKPQKAAKRVVEAFFPMSPDQAQEVQRVAAEALGVPLTMELDCGKGVKLPLILIPPGWFVMGSPEYEIAWFPSEGPQHEVTISKPFYMGKFPVTQAQYEAVTGEKPSHFKKDDDVNPVESVSWDEACEFCVKLTKRTGRAVRLPTEAQWEYACRAGSRSGLGFGKDLDEYAWHAAGGCLGLQTTWPVGLKKPNAFGLYDMHGNVGEWCEDNWHGDYKNAPTDGSAWRGGDSSRVVRGGSWCNWPLLCGSARRSWRAPDGRDDDLGFRVVYSFED